MKNNIKLKNKKFILGSLVVGGFGAGIITSLVYEASPISKSLKQQQIYNLSQSQAAIANQGSTAGFSVDTTKAQAAISSYAQAMNRAYSSPNSIAVPQAGVSDKLTAQGSYMPFLDMGMIYWSTLKGITSTFATNKQNLYYGSFLTAPNRGFKDESGNEGWSSDALVRTMNATNYDYQNVNAKNGGDFDIPVAYGGAFSYDFAAKIDAPASDAANANLFNAIRNKGGDIMLSIGGWRSNSFAPTVVMAADNSGKTDKFNEYYLAAIYAYIIDKLHLNALDFDIEGTDMPGLNVSSGGVLDDGNVQFPGAAAPNVDQAKRGLEMRLKALKILKSIPQYQKVKISFTLPTLMNGFKDNYLYDMVLQALNNNLIYRVYLMTMDYGIEQRRTIPGEMAMQAISATNALVEKLHNDPNYLLDKDYNILYSKIGIIPMLGKNDVKYEVFTLTDAKILTNFAIVNNVAAIAPWSYNKDIEANKVGDAKDFVSGWDQGTMEQNFDQAEVEKTTNKTGVPINGKMTLLDTTYQAYGTIFANIAQKTPIPASDILISDPLRKLLVSYGFDSLNKLYQSRTAFYNVQNLPDIQVSDLNSAYIDERNFNSGYNHASASSSTSTASSGSGVAIPDEYVKTPVDQRDAKWGPTGTGTKADLSYGTLPLGKYVWSDNAWYRVIGEADLQYPGWGPKEHPTSYQKVFASNDTVTPVDIALGNASKNSNMVTPEMKNASDDEKETKWSIFGGSEFSQANYSGSAFGYWKADTVVWYPDNDQAKAQGAKYDQAYTNKWYRITADTTVDINGQNDWVPNASTMGRGFEEIKVGTDASALQAYATKVQAIVPASVHWTKAFKDDGIVNNVQLKTPQDLLGVLDSSTTDVPTKNLIAILSDQDFANDNPVVSLSIDPSEKNTSFYASKKRIVNLAWTHNGLNLELHMPVTFNKNQQDLITQDLNNSGLKNINFASAATKIFLAPKAQIFAGDASPIISTPGIQTIIPQTIIDNYTIGAEYKDVANSGNYTPSLIFTSKTMPWIVHTIPMAGFMVQSFESQITASSSLTAKLHSEDPSTTLIDANDFVSSNPKIKITKVVYLPPAAGSTMAFSNVTVEYENKSYDLRIDMKFTKPASLNLNHSTSTTSLNTSGQLVTQDERANSMILSNYDLNDQTNLGNLSPTVKQAIVNAATVTPPQLDYTVDLGNNSGSTSSDPSILINNVQVSALKTVNEKTWNQANTYSNFGDMFLLKNANGATITGAIVAPDAVMPTGDSGNVKVNVSLALGTATRVISINYPFALSQAEQDKREAAAQAQTANSKFATMHVSTTKDVDQSDWNSLTSSDFTLSNPQGGLITSVTVKAGSTQPTGNTGTVPYQVIVSLGKITHSFDVDVNYVKNRTHDFDGISFSTPTVNETNWNALTKTQVTLNGGPSGISISNLVLKTGSTKPTTDSGVIMYVATVTNAAGDNRNFDVPVNYSVTQKATVTTPATTTGSGTQNNQGGTNGQGNTQTSTPDSTNSQPDTNTSGKSTTTSNSNSGISVGAIAGIAVGSAVGGAGLIGGITWFLRRKKGL